MKNKLLILLSIVLFSCGTNEDNIQSGIIGKWNKTKETKEFSNGTTENVSLSNCDLKETLELKSNLEVILTRYSGTDCNQANTSEGVYSYDESSNELILPGNNKQLVEVNGNKMTFKFTVTGLNNYIKTIYFTRIE